MNWRTEDLAYLAGFADGEGSITIFQYRGRDQLRFDVYNTQREVLDWIADTFGGCVHEVGRSREGWKQEYVWAPGPQLAATILEACLPYLKVKRKQAELFISHAATSRKRGAGFKSIPVHIATFRASVVEKIQALNKRGVAITRQADGAPR